MPWVRFDDQFPIHRKVDALSDAAYRLHSAAIFWSARNLTDGRIRADELLLVRAKATAAQVTEIVRRDLWHEPGHTCPDCPQPVDGWVIHDYLKFQPSRDQVSKDRDAKAKRQQRWRSTRGGGDATRDASTPPSRNATRDASRNATRDASRDGPGDASRDAPVDAAPYPYPPRPEGKRGGDLPEAPDDRRQAADAAADGRKNQPQNRRPPPMTSTNGTTNGSGSPESQAVHGPRRNALAAAARAAIRQPAARAPRREGLAELRAATDPPTEESP